MLGQHWLLELLPVFACHTVAPPTIHPQLSSPTAPPMAHNHNLTHLLVFLCLRFAHIASLACACTVEPWLPSKGVEVPIGVRRVKHNTIDGFDTFVLWALHAHLTYAPKYTIINSLVLA